VVIRTALRRSPHPRSAARIDGADGPVRSIWLLPLLRPGTFRLNFACRARSVSGSVSHKLVWGGPVAGGVVRMVTSSWELPLPRVISFPTSYPVGMVTPWSQLVAFW
jgi:hypothetical protein